MAHPPATDNRAPALPAYLKYPANHYGMAIALSSYAGHCVIEIENVFALILMTCVTRLAPEPSQRIAWEVKMPEFQQVPDKSLTVRAPFRTTPGQRQLGLPVNGLPSLPAQASGKAAGKVLAPC
jgi:hypothetical protein